MSMGLYQKYGLEIVVINCMQLGCIESRDMRLLIYLGDV